RRPRSSQHALAFRVLLRSRPCEGRPRLAETRAPTSKTDHSATATNLNEAGVDVDDGGGVGRAADRQAVVLLLDPPVEAHEQPECVLAAARRPSHLDGERGWQRLSVEADDAKGGRLRLGCRSPPLLV